MESLTIQPVASYWIIALIMGVVAASLWAGPGFRELSPHRRMALFWIRFALVGLALLALLRPGVVSTVRQKQTGVLPILLDHSRSMELSHLATGPSRWNAMQEVIADCREAIARLREQDIHIHFYAFGNSAKLLDATGSIPTLPEAPPDSETDLGSALYSVIDAVRDQRLLGIIMASDGVQNAAEPEVELSQAARLLEDSQTPLITVPFGQSVEAREFADISVENMADQFSVWVKNDLVVAATVHARGFANQEIPVQLIVTDREGNEVLADTVRHLFTRQTESVEVELRYTPEREGQYRLSVRAEPQPGEVSPRNNELPAFLTVNEGGLRVLYVFGSLGWEQSFLRRGLGSYQDIQLDELYIDQRSRDRWPEDFSARFSDPVYDVFILHDIDSRALYADGLGEKSLQALTDSVMAGKGLLMIGGYHSFGPGLYANTPLAQVLPVQMAITEKQDFDADLRADLHIERELRMLVSRPHFVTQLGDPAENALIWDELPPLVGANRFAGLKDTAGVLLESQSGDPLLVAARVGGRVLAFAGDSTWKWWGHGKKDLHKRFWRQAVLWLAFKDNQSGDQVRIDLPQRRFQPNSVIRFTAEASSQGNEPIANAQFSGTLTGPDGRKAPLSVLSGAQSYIDRELVEKPGLYRIEIAAARDGEPVGEAAAEFVVFDNDKETSNPAADVDQLRRLSERTAVWGGKLIAPNELSAILEEFAEATPTLDIEVPLKWQLGDTLYDGLAFVLLFAGLLATEWWLRKKWGLV